MRRIALAIAIGAYLLAVLAFRPHPTPGPAMRDFEAYYAAGAAWDRGEDPYGAGIWTYERAVPGVDASRERLLPFVNPPPLLPLLGAIARLPFGAAAALWGALLFGALVALLACAARLVGVREPDATVALLPLALAFGPVSSDLALGQFALVAVAGVAYAALGFRRDRLLVAGIGTFFAALQPTLVLPLAAFGRSARALHALLAAATVFALGWIVLAATSSAAAPLPYFALLAAHGSAERFAAIQYAPSAIAFGLGGSPASATALGIAIASATVAAWCAWLLRAKPDAQTAFLTACALVPFVAPFFHEHDFALLLLPALVAIVVARDATTTALAVGGALLCAVDWLGLAQRPDGAWQSALLLVAFCGALAAIRGYRFAGAGYVAAAAVAVALAIAGVLAAGHPAPVWPGAMGPLSLAPGASAAQIWHEQQRAAHMFDPDAFSAILRALPLLGCASVAIAIARLPRVPSDSRNP